MARKARTKRRKLAPGLWQVDTDTYEIRLEAKNPYTGKLGVSAARGASRAGVPRRS